MRLITKKPVAVARVKGNKTEAEPIGIVRFYQFPGGVLLETDITGLPSNGSGFYGFHIHTGRSCVGPDFTSAGNHLALSGLTHPQHAGDLPPLLSYNGRAYMTVMTDRFSIRDILGRTVVIHQKPDNFVTQPAGNSGDRIACGVIEKV